MITGLVAFVGGLFFQKFYPVIGDMVVSRVQAGWTAARSWLASGAPKDPKA